MAKRREVRAFLLPTGNGKRRRKDKGLSSRGGSVKIPVVLSGAPKEEVTPT
jgi:hypothetical protein